MCRLRPPLVRRAIAALAELAAERRIARQCPEGRDEIFIGFVENTAAAVPHDLRQAAEIARDERGAACERFDRHRREHLVGKRWNTRRDCMRVERSESAWWDISQKMDA